MSSRLWLCFLAFYFLAFQVVGSDAQSDPARASAIHQRLQQLERNVSKLPPGLQASMAEYNRLLRLTAVAAKLAKRSDVSLDSTKSTAKAANDAASGPTEQGGLVPVNNRALDLEFGRFSGFTDNTSSTARCGNQVVVGFNDSASILQTLIAGSGGISFSGVAVSDNGGESFKDMGFVPPGPNTTDFTFGEPSVTCSNPSHFYYTQLFSTIGANFDIATAIGFSKSSDGGHTFSPPVPAVLKSSQHILDSEWSAVDPFKPKRIYISYRDVDFSHTSTTCPSFDLRTAIEVVVSNNGGQTFSSPIVVAEQCFSQNFEIVLASRIAVSGHGKVFVAWQDYFIEPLTVVDVAVSSFVPGGTPSAPVIVDTAFQGGVEVEQRLFGDEFILQGGFQNYRGIDLAVDHSRKASDGTIYVVWNDGRNKSVPDTVDPFGGNYNFDDVLFSVSTDGQTFSPSARLNSDAQPASGRGHDHFQPAIAVDGRGKVAACWKDRRRDPQNYRFDRFCAESRDSGSTWTEFLVPGSTSSPSAAQDGIVFPDSLGNHDTLTTDFTRRKIGFIGAFQWVSSGMNPDIKAHSFD